MSESKRVMADHLSVVQSSLMGMSFESLTLDSLLPIIFKECLKENLTFWFNYVENSLVLNLRDIRFENYELNIRYHYQPTNNDESIDDVKLQLLMNTFLITKDNVSVSNVASSKKQEEETLIISGDKPVPPHIRKAIDKIQSKGIPVTREAIQNHLPLGKMSTSARLECNKYLKEMD